MEVLASLIVRSVIAMFVKIFHIVQHVQPHSFKAMITLSASANKLMRNKIILVSALLHLNNMGGVAMNAQSNFAMPVQIPKFVQNVLKVLPYNQKKEFASVLINLLNSIRLVLNV